MASNVSSSVGEGWDRRYVGENVRLHWIHALPETQIPGRVLQIFHDQQYVDYFRLSFKQRVSIVSVKAGTLAISEI